MYESIQDILSNNRGKYNTVITGDFNAVVGEGKENKSMGMYGLGKRNDRAEKLINFAKRNDFLISSDNQHIVQTP